MMEKEYIGARNRLLPMLIIVKDNKFGKESIRLLFHRQQNNYSSNFL